MPDIGGVDEAKLAQLELWFKDQNMAFDDEDIQLLFDRCQTAAWEGSVWLELVKANAYNEGYSDGHDAGETEAQREAAEDSRPPVQTNSEASSE